MHTDEHTPTLRIFFAPFDGVAAPYVRTLLARALDAERGFHVVGLAELEKRDLSVSGSDAEYLRATRELNLTATVNGSVGNPAPADFRLDIVVRDGRDGSELDHFQVHATRAADLSLKAAKQLESRLPKALAAEPKGKAYAITSETSDSSDEDVGRQKDGTTPQAFAPPTCVEAQVRAGTSTRSFGYEEEVSGALRKYDLHWGGEWGLSLRVYPAARVAKGLLANLGVQAWYEQLLGVSSHIEQKPLATTSHAYGFGGRVRARVWQLDLTGGLAYGRQLYRVADTYVPDPDYRFVRFDAEASWRPRRFVVAVDLGYRQLFSTGELGSGDWFPRLGAAAPFSRGFGVEGELMVGYGVGDHFELLLGGRLLRYSVPLHPAPEDASANGVAGRAHDLYAAMFGAVGARL